MEEIGILFRKTREQSGLSLEEVSNDIKISVTDLENIENGNSEAFKEIFYLKEYLRSYAKYLGLNPDLVIDDFNSYIFDKTSKVPVKKIKKASKKANDRVAKSPYTAPAKGKLELMILIVVLIILIVIVAIAVL